MLHLSKISPNPCLRLVVPWVPHADPGTGADPLLPLSSSFRVV